MKNITRHDSSIQPDVTGEDLDQCAALFECIECKNGEELGRYVECLHADTCLSDYWGGHHLPHVCFPVWPNMTLAEIKECLHSEVSQGAIAGNIPEELAYNTYELSEKGYREFYKAIESIEGNNGKIEGFFSDIEAQDCEDCEDCGEYIYAYFVFQPVE